MYKSVNEVPLWVKQSGAKTKYQWLDGDITCDVLVVGAGVAGALCALRLAQAGANTVLLGEGPVGYGSTASSEGVISYQFNEGLTTLAQNIGMDNAVKVMRMCSSAIDTVEQLCGEHDNQAGFTRRDSFYYTDSEKNVAPLTDEYLARRHNGFAVEMIDRQAAMEMFSFPVAAGIYSPGQAAELDPYLFTQSIAEEVVVAGGTVYENTPVCEIETTGNTVKVITGTGRTVTADKVVLATATGNSKCCCGIRSPRTAFTVVTKPVAEFEGWKDQALLCGDGSPNIRLRTTPDRRIMLSGLDCGLLGSGGKLAGVVPVPQLTQKKFAELKAMLPSMFPGIRGIEPEFCYTTQYTATDDGLPVIGPSQNNPNIYLDLCTGGNGLAFAVLAADMLAGLYSGNPNQDMNLFAPDRSE